MSSDFHALLNATLEHLQHLKSSGVRTVEVRPETLAALTAAPSKPAAPRPVSRAPGPAPTTLARPSAVPIPSITPRREAASQAPPVLQARPAPPPVAPVLSPATTSPIVTDRESAMAEIRERALVCQKCPHLAGSRTQVVFGVGNLEAELMFVGEAPGADEDRLGEPFIGPAGQLLTRIIGAMRLSRSTVYIANILKCRPDMPAGAYGNRAPRPDEMETCKPYLLSQIEIIRPKVLVALGNTAVQGLLGTRGTLGSVRGRWQEFRGIPVMPTFHPSYLLRAEEGPDRGHTEKRKTWEDMLAVLERLGHPIDDRMRGYFLKPGGG